MPTDTEETKPECDVIAISQDAARQMLGGISRVTFWRKMKLLGYSKTPFGTWLVEDINRAARNLPKA